ncbi:L-seryl-tRNA(Sec) kinase isoform X2 [Anolis sagrei]|uniref:L-seryl-tRNA(Sec) kinase isoform X2 n=1 Tax=Anolis sagrei TaxID=38937 RepID=UPI00351FF2F5
MAQKLQKGRVHQLGLCLLCGLPAAGKTTTGQALSQSLRKHKGWQCVLLTYDDLIPMEAFTQMKELEEQPSLMGSWRLYRHELLLCLEHFLQAHIKGCHYSPPQNITETTWERFVCCLKEQGLISAGREDSASCQYLIDFTSPSPIYFVLDDNFYYRSMRYEVYQLARQYTLGFCQLFLDCQVEVCLERNSQRKQPLPEETIHAMAQKIECPNPENLQMLDLLSAALENPVKPLEENTELKEMDRAICATSALHQADQAVRRIVSQTMKNAKDNNVALHELKSLAEELNRLKLEFLEGLRHKSNENNQCCLQNNTFNVNVTSSFSQEADDVVKKYLNKK